MFDDLDDLLDDIPVNRSKPTPKPSAASNSLLKAKSSKPDDEFDWDKGVSS